MYKYTVGLLALLLFCGSCQENSEAQRIIDRTLEAHGSSRLEDLALSFDFRDRHYTYARQHGAYTYTRSFTDSTGKVRDVLTNSGFHRLIEGDTASLSDERKNAFSNSVNSVLYFALLPYGLNDEAVLKSYLGQTQLEGKPYHLVSITFKEEGGGEDHEDKFLYWINTDTKTMDFMAYQYYTEGGGLRFRKAINPRTIGGVRFQDYVNYKPKQKDSSLEELQEAYEKGELEKLSLIQLENIEVEPPK